jgi:hypothetical protein
MSSGLKSAPTHAQWLSAVQALRTVIDGARANRGTAY